MKTIDVVLLNIIHAGVCRELGLPANTPLLRLGKRIAGFILDEAELLQKNAEQSGSLAILRSRNLPLTLENYLAFNGMTEEDCVADMLEVIPDLFQPEAIRMRVDNVMEAIEIDETLRKMEG